MPDTLNNYVLQERPIVPMVDLGILSNSLATINQGNKEALKTQSELKAAIGNIDLNEAEDGYKEQLYNDIEKTVKDNSIEGNAYFALDDLITKKGDIEKNEGLLGRIKAQQAYKKNIADLDERVKRGDITRDTAEWAKEMNPYHYEDKYKTDVDGNVVLGKDGKPIIIGGTDWAPDLVPVKDVDINKVYVLASQYIKPKKSSWESTTFVDENGNISKTYKPGYFILNKVDGKKEEVTRQMVDNAINMAINANPEIEASMKQSFEVAKWKYSKGDINNNLAYDNTGKLKSYNQYRNDLIDPYINQMIYSETQSSTEWNNSGLQLMYKQKAKEELDKSTGGLGINAEDAVRNATSVMGNPIELDKDIFGSSLGKINQGKAKLSNITGIPMDNIPDTYEDFINTVQSVNGIISDTQRKVAKDFYDIYGTQIQNNNNRKNSNSELDAATIVHQYLQQNISLSQINGTNPHLKKYIDEYNNFINNLFGDSETITFKPKDINKVLTSKEERQRYENLGFRIKDNSIILDKSNDNLAYTFAYLMNEQQGDFYRGDNKLTYGLIGLMGNTSITPLQRASDEAFLTPQQKFDKKINWPSDVTKQADNLKHMIEVAYQDAEVKQIKDNDNKIVVGTGSLSTFTVGDTLAQQILEETGEAKVKSMRDAAKARVIDAFRTGNLIDNEVYQAIYDEKSGTYNYKELNRAQKLNIINELAGIEDNDITGNLSYIQGYEFKQGFTYPRKIYDDGKDTHATEEVKLIFGVNQNDPELEALNDMDFIRAGKELMGSYINEEAVNIGKLNDNYITVKGIQDPANIKFSDTFEIDISGDFMGVCNTTTAMNLLQSYRTLINDRKDFKIGSDVDKSIANYVEENPNIWNNYVNAFGEKRAFDIISNILLNY